MSSSSSFSSKSVLALISLFFCLFQCPVLTQSVLLCVCVHFSVIWHRFLALTGDSEQTGAEEVVGGAEFATGTFTVE